jgi:hypothetical protein
VHYDHQLVGVSVPEWTQQDRLDRAEHRGVRTDADAEDQDDAGAQGWRSPHDPQAVADIAQQTLEPRGAALVTVLFFHLLDASEAPARGEPGLLRREPRHPCVTLGELEVRTDFGVEFAIEPVAREQREDPLDHAPHGLTPRKRAIIAADCSQLAISACSRFAPTRVSS